MHLTHPTTAPSTPQSLDVSAPQSLDVSAPHRPVSRRGRKKHLTREVAAELVKCRMTEGKFDEEGVEFPRRTLEQFARDMKFEGVVGYMLHPAMLSRLFSGKLYPDLEVDGELVDWSAMPPSRGRGPATGETLARDGRTFREVVDALAAQVSRLASEVQYLREAHAQLRDAHEQLREQLRSTPAPGGAL